MRRKKLIGIPPTLNNNLGVSREYHEFFSYFGNVIILPTTKELIDIDLLVLPGGADICPSRYSTDRFFSYGGNPNRFYEWFDTQVLPGYIQRAMNREMGIFGICRGLQTINVALGGTLYQHLLDEVYNPELDRSKLTQTGIVLDTVRDVWNGPKEIKFNSMHHQAIRQLGAGLVPTILSKNPVTATENYEPFKVIEGIRHKTGKIWGVQYHPEEIYDLFSNKIINHILYEKL